MRPFVKVSLILCDDFIWEIWVISETWLDYSKLTYHNCKSTNKGPKNGSITFKGHKAGLLKAILAKTSNFWPGLIELKFWNLILKMIHFNISLRQSHGSIFGPLMAVSWPLEVQKVQKLIRHHIWGNFSLPFRFGWILFGGFGFSQKFWKISQISG